MEDRDALDKAAWRLEVVRGIGIVALLLLDLLLLGAIWNTRQKQSAIAARVDKIGTLQELSVGEIRQADTDSFIANHRRTQALLHTVIANQEKILDRLPEGK